MIAREAQLNLNMFFLNLNMFFPAVPQPIHFPRSVAISLRPSPC